MLVLVLVFMPSKVTRAGEDFDFGAIWAEYENISYYVKELGYTRLIAGTDGDGSRVQVCAMNLGYDPGIYRSLHIGRLKNEICDVAWQGKVHASSDHVVLLVLPNGVTWKPASKLTEEAITWNGVAVGFEQFRDEAETPLYVCGGFHPYKKEYAVGTYNNKTSTCSLVDGGKAFKVTRKEKFQILMH